VSCDQLTDNVVVHLRAVLGSVCAVKGGSDGNLKFGSVEFCSFVYKGEPQDGRVSAGPGVGAGASAGAQGPGAGYAGRAGAWCR